GRVEGYRGGVPRHAAVTPVTLVTGLRLPPLSSPQGGPPLLLSPLAVEGGRRVASVTGVTGRGSAALSSAWLGVPPAFAWALSRASFPTRRWRPARRATRTPAPLA